VKTTFRVLCLNSSFVHGCNYVRRLFSLDSPSSGLPSSSTRWVSCSHDCRPLNLRSHLIQRRQDRFQCERGEMQNAYFYALSLNLLSLQCSTGTFWPDFQAKILDLCFSWSQCYHRILEGGRKEIHVWLAWENTARARKPSNEKKVKENVMWEFKISLIIWGESFHINSLLCGLYRTGLFVCRP